MAKVTLGRRVVTLRQQDRCDKSSINTPTRRPLRALNYPVNCIRSLVHMITLNLESCYLRHVHDAYRDKSESEASCAERHVR